MSRNIETKIKFKEGEDRAFILDFIKTYKSLPFLWDTKLKEYSDRTKKAQQYTVLLKKYREKYPNARKPDVTKKINSLRTNFRRELKRLNELSKNEPAYSRFIEPSLWYFEELSFIKSNMNIGARGEIVQEEEEEEGEIQEIIEETPVLKKSKKNNVEPTNELADPLSLRFENDADNFKKMGDVWASKLKSMDSIQQLYAEKFINEILFEGVLGNLHRKAVQIFPENKVNHNTRPKPNSLKCNNLKKHHQRNHSIKISNDYDYSDFEENFDCKTDTELYSDTESL